MLETIYIYLLSKVTKTFILVCNYETYLNTYSIEVAMLVMFKLYMDKYIIIII